SPAARRRRRRKSKEEVIERASESRLISHELEKITTPKKIGKSNTPMKDYPVDNAVHSHNNMNSTSPSDWCIRLSDSNFSETVTPMTDREEHRTSSTVSVKRIKRVTIEEPNNTTKLDETENFDIEPANHRENSENSRIIRRSTVTVLRVSKSNEVNQNHSITSQQNILSASSAKSLKLDQIKVIKIPRSQSTVDQRTRATSVGNVVNIPLRKSFIEMRSITDLSKTAALATNINVYKDNPVTVKKLPRKSTNLQSRPS
ncbi:unnamed protein product, partial [Rotaria sp. Silwood1]